MKNLLEYLTPVPGIAAFSDAAGRVYLGKLVT